MTNPADVTILRHLFDPTQPLVSGARLAAELGCSRTAVWKRIEALGQAGYVIEARPHAGYRLVRAEDVLVADEIRARLPGNIFAEQLTVFRETSSTNDVVLKAAEHGAPHGFTVLAESQATGRGRLGRRWVSTPARGLWFSVLFRSTWGQRRSTPQALTMLAAVAVARALERDWPGPVAIKWPNDLVFPGGKLCGILVEARIDADRLHHGVVGIGLNVNHRRNDFPEELQGRASSLFLEDGRERRRADVLVAILEELERAGEERAEAVASAWRDRCEMIGRRIRVETASGLHEGEMAGVTEDGLLLLRKVGGSVETIAAGTVL